MGEKGDKKIKNKEEQSEEKKEGDICLKTLTWKMLFLSKKLKAKSMTTQ